MPKSIVLFDGVCHLCNRTVQFIIRHDPQGHFQFASLQSHQGQKLISDYGIAENESIVLIERARVYIASTAALRIARKLSGLWPLFYFLIILPRPLRDGAYSVLARHRYRWFGRQDACIAPTLSGRERFLE